MPDFNTYFSNRSEVLVSELAHVVSSPPLPPLQKEIIVVQSKGMERWLVQQLGARFGIWANGSFPFPNAMIQELFGAVVGALPTENPFTPELLAWRIQRLLPGYLNRPGFESLSHYGADARHGLKLAQLCYRVADAFDQYSIYRPEMILRWELGEESHWQAQLWRAVVAEIGVGHRARVRQQFFERLREIPAVPAALPARISVFGISALPSFHVDVFMAISQFADVHLFLMNPSREFWADIVSEKQQAKRRQRERRQMQLAFPANPYFETGHPLLASLGRRGRDFSALLLDRGEGQEWSHYEDPGDETLLACLQSDILNLRHRGRDGFRKDIPPADTSLQIHSCHSPMREMEVLHDQLLALFDADPELWPNDILVMTPDIEAYAPYISAVFAGEHQQQGSIPFSVSDRSELSSNSVVRSFFKLLELGTSRLPAPAVMDLLDIPLVQRRFDIRPEERGLLRRWVEETRIRWGIDSNDRARQGVPPFEENSWKAGLDRLLLGYALPSEGDGLFSGILPFNEVEGSGGQALGRFLEFAKALFAMARDLPRPRTLSEWSESLLEWMSWFLASDEDVEQEFQVLRAGVKHLAEVQRLSGFDQLIELGVARYALEARLTSGEAALGFLTGGVTFCAMLPMRSIPFKVIALVGMGSKTFPRTQRPAGFDLIASDPRPGDRSVREEDRYLFLEALLSARQKLIVSYVGQSIKDNSEIPPSVVVSELIEAVEQGFTLGPRGDGILDHICLRHRLQAFSSSYFEGRSGLFSYSEENLNALRARQAGQFREGTPDEPIYGEQQLSAGASPSQAREPKIPNLLRDNLTKPFVSAPIGEPPEEFRNVDLRELRRFYRNPTAYFLRQRLGLRLDEDRESAEGREPFALHVLDAYGLEQEMVERKLAGKSLVDAYPSVRHRGLLPAGAAGELVFQDAVASVEAFASLLLPLIQGEPLPSVDLDFTTAGFRVTGKVGQIWPRHLLRYRCAAVKAKDRLDLWIDHLLLQTSEIPGYPNRSVLLAKETGWSFGPVANALEIFHQLLNYYWEGLSAPLPFFPQSAHAYAERRHQGRKEEDALYIARKAWEGDRRS
ncbi:MAG TPA: exodeoxyribonuclease V subunit gamma, partial [Terriglobia bacterium]|nr:exodeoxyribonuclease V subunit gamma [Terriglobia bacterium]